MADEADIALFPLQTVLYPGGLLPLRVFEARYVDMVSHCMRHGEVFGVVLITAGTETSSTVSTATVGTSARIVDFQALEDGLLGLLCRGERRFRIADHSRQADGLNRAQVEWLTDEAVTLSQEYQPLVPILQQVMANLTNVSRFIEPNYQDAMWVSHRLAEFLPLEPTQQQRLLEIDDAYERLRLLAPLIDARDEA